MDYYLNKPKVLLVEKIDADDFSDEFKLAEGMLAFKKCIVSPAKISDAWKILRLEDHSENRKIIPYPHGRQDVNMICIIYSPPGTEQYKLLEKIKESTAMKHLPVVIVSRVTLDLVPGQSSNELNRWTRAGAALFIPRPLRMSDLGRLLSLMDGSTSSSTSADHVDPPHVLVVDDDDVSRDRMRKMFTSCNCKVTAVRNGVYVLVLIRGDIEFSNLKNAEEVRLVVIKSILQEGGYELLKKLRGSYAMKDVLPLFYTSAIDPAKPNEFLINNKSLLVEANKRYVFTTDITLSDVKKILTLLQ